jgi:hypothetical protein
MAYERTTLPEALVTPSLKALANNGSIEPVVVATVQVLAKAYALHGGGLSPQQLALVARVFMEDFGGRPVGSILMAIRNGVRQSTVGHKLTYPILCEWMRAQDAAVEEHNYTQHLLNR